MDVVERKERVSTKRMAKTGRESVALRHAAAAALTDNRGLTTDCLFVLAGWMQQSSQQRLPPTPLCLPPRVFATQQQVCSRSERVLLICLLVLKIAVCDSVFQATWS